jgi:hypothetical protein
VRKNKNSEVIPDGPKRKNPWVSFGLAIFFFLIGLMGMYVFPPNHVSVPEERNLIQQSGLISKRMESKGRGSYGYSDFKITSGSGGEYFVTVLSDQKFKGKFEKGNPVKFWTDREGGHVWRVSADDLTISPQEIEKSSNSWASKLEFAIRMFFVAAFLSTFSGFLRLRKSRRPASPLF